MLGGTNRLKFRLFLNIGDPSVPSGYWWNVGQANITRDSIWAKCKNDEDKAGEKDKNVMSTRIFYAYVNMNAGIEQGWYSGRWQSIHLR